MDPNDLSFTELLDRITDGVYAVDRARRIVSWNTGAEEITGFGRKRVVGAFCHDNILRHIDDAGKALCHAGCPLLATMKDGVVREDLVYLHHQKGHRVPVHVKTMPVNDKRGAIIGAVEIFSDATPANVMAARLEELERAAMTDPLTGLPNRRYLDMSLGTRLHELRSGGPSLGVLLMDVDRFKLVNDTHGHLVGDEILRLVARTLRHALRATDDVGRWGGEEFVALVGCEQAKLYDVADRFRTMVGESTLRDHDPPLSATISIGGAIATVADTPESLMRRADAQMYAAKDAGRNCTRIDDA